MIVNILFGLVVGAAVNGYEFPQNFKRCGTNDKNLDACLVTAIQNAFQLIGTTGITSLGLTSIDPLKVPNLEIGAGSGAVNLVQRYKDANVYGLSKSKVLAAHFDKDKSVLTFTAVHPEVRQEAKYSLKGNLLVFSVSGSGESVLKLKEPTFVHKITFKEQTKNGKKYLHVDSYKLDINVKGAHYDFEDLFNGDKAVTANILNVINENWNVIFDDVRSGVENAYGNVFKTIAGKLFDSIPADEIFPN